MMADAIMPHAMPLRKQTLLVSRQTSYSPNQYVENHSNLALAICNLLVGRINSSELRGLVVCQSVHGSLGEIEATSSVVDGKDIDCLALVCDAVAGTTLIEGISI
jgi:hypothetical protein